MKKIVRITTITYLFALFFVAVYGNWNYLSPTRMAVHPLTGEVYVVLSGTSALGRVDLKTEKPVATLALGFTPSDLCFSADGKMLYVTEYAPEGKLHLYSTETNKRIKSIRVGAYPAAVCVNRKGTRVWVANRFSNDLSVVDLRSRKELVRLPMVREPKSLALSPDGTVLAVGNHLPSQSALDKEVAARVTLVDAGRDVVLTDIPLRDGSHSVEDVCFSGQGDLLFITHVLSRYPFPTTQLERGWMNTNAVSVICIPDRKYDTTVLLDDMYLGAANPCGMALSEDGRQLFVAVSGTHELIALSLPSMLKKIKETPKSNIPNNLTFLNGDKERIPLCGKGARYVAVQDKKVIVSDYFSGGLSVVDIASTGDKRFIKLGEEPEPDEIRRGELFFADAALCFQHWQSCVSCHPGGRADGLNWDLMNDGLGNPKNTKSMLYTHVTPPCMITGIRPNAEVAVRAGIKHIQFATRSEEDAICIDKYLRSLVPLPSPYLEKGKLSRVAQKGKRLFEQVGCLDCHNGKYYTDGNKYNAETGIEEYTHVPFNTPALTEAWRTAPYLYNGKAETIREVLTTFNKEDKHGVTSGLTDKEIEALEEYVLSL